MLSRQPTSGESKSAKAELAQRLNHARKAFLVQLKSQISVDITSDVDATVAANVENFQRQFSNL